MKIEKQTGCDIFSINFPSKIVDVEMKNLLIVNLMFKDNKYTATKLQGFKKLLEIEQDLDNAHLYILARVVASDFPRRSISCENFELPPIIVARLLEDLKSYGFLEEHVDEDGFGSSSENDKKYCLSKRFWSKLIGEDVQVSKEDTNKDVVKNKYIIKSSTIKKVDLYYDEDLIKSLEGVRKILDENNLKGIKSRILEDNQHAGICISFYGPSGTGKTEKVLQLCKEAGRDIYNYNIADSETRYCGMKQKLINKMFSDFKSVVDKYKNAGLNEPILLLNEADALFAKRHDDETDTNTTANRENNQLQAELLNHIENFDGILFITTNRLQNFDEAMERRFLYKIKFDNPNTSTQQAIWKNKFPNLVDDDIEKVVSAYDTFTGGNIQNIKKKASIDYIIDGNKANIAKILELCKDEKLENEKQRKIGFC